MTPKERFIRNILDNMTLIIQASNNIEDSIKVYFDRGYQSGGGAPLAQEDLDPFGIALADFNNTKVFSDNFRLMKDGEAPALNDYEKIFNAVRQDK